VNARSEFLVLTSDRDFSWRELGANTAGGAVGGAAAGACVTVTANPALCGAAGAAASNLVRTALSDEEGFSPERLGFETFGGAVFSFGAGQAAGRIPGLRINPNWFTPSRISNVWNPGPWATRFYGQTAVDAGSSVVGGYALAPLLDFVTGC